MNTRFTKKGSSEPPNEWEFHQQQWECTSVSPTENVMQSILVGGFNHLEKYELVNGKNYPIYEIESKTWLKPPTSIKFHIYL